MGELDQVSESIGQLKGLMEGSNGKIDDLHTEVRELKTQVIKINTEGTSRAKSNSHRIDKIETTKLTSMDWAKLSGVVTFVSGIVVGICKGIEQAFKQ